MGLDASVFKAWSRPLITVAEKNQLKHEDGCNQCVLCIREKVANQECFFFFHSHFDSDISTDFLIFFKTMHAAFDINNVS